MAPETVPAVGWTEKRDGSKSCSSSKMHQAGVATHRDGAATEHFKCSLKAGFSEALNAGYSFSKLSDCGLVGGSPDGADWPRPPLSDLDEVIEWPLLGRVCGSGNQDQAIAAAHPVPGG